jgi:hypothetical protein
VITSVVPSWHNWCSTIISRCILQICKSMFQKPNKMFELGRKEFKPCIIAWHSLIFPRY